MFAMNTEPREHGQPSSQPDRPTPPDPGRGNPEFGEFAVIGIGVYMAATDRYALGGIIGGVGISILPFAVAGLIGAVVCLAAAGLGWYFARISVLVAVLVGVLSVITIADRIRKLR